MVANYSPDNVQSVNAAHEFRICVRAQLEHLKEHVSVKIHFK